MGFKRLLNFYNVTNFEKNSAYNKKILDVLSDFKIGYASNIHLYVPSAKHPRPEDRICYIVSSKNYLYISEISPSTTKNSKQHSKLFDELEKELLKCNIEYLSKNRMFKIDPSTIDVFLSTIKKLFGDIERYKYENKFEIVESHDKSLVLKKGVLENIKIDKKRILKKELIDEFTTNENIKFIDFNNIKQEINEKIRKNETFDVFLSHRKLDEKEVIFIYNLFRKQGLSVYIDWIVDKQLDRTNVNRKTATRLRERMKMSNTLVFLMTNNSQDSKWMPWELGYFDGLNKKIAVMPYENSKEEFKTQEYLFLYDICYKDLKLDNGKVFKKWMLE